MSKFIKRPSDICEGNIHEVRVQYDEYGVVSIQQAPLDDAGFEDDKVIEVFEHAISDIRWASTIVNPDIDENGYRNFYVSLVRNFMGSCLIIRAKDREHVRKYAHNYLGRMWCSVYDEPGNMTITGKIIQVNEEGME